MTYSSSLAVGRGRYVSRNRNSVSFKSSTKKIGPITNTVTLIVLACLLGLLYLSQVTRTNTYGYQISDLKKQESSLQEKHSDLELASARLQSLSRVKDSAASQKLVAAKPVATVKE